MSSYSSSRNSNSPHIFGQTRYNVMKGSERKKKELLWLQFYYLNKRSISVSSYFLSLLSVCLLTEGYWLPNLLQKWPIWSKNNMIQKRNLIWYCSPRLILRLPKSLYELFSVKPRHGFPNCIWVFQVIFYLPPSFSVGVWKFRFRPWPRI